MGWKPITVNTPAEEPAHILAEDDATLYDTIIGSDCVLPVGGQLEASIISNNSIRITDGMVVVGGHVGRIVKDDYEDMAIANGVSGQNRNDLIVARFISGGTSGADTYSLVVVQGTPGTTAQDPDIIQGDLYAGDEQRDYPLWRVRLEGLNIEGLDKLYEVGTMLRGKADAATHNLITYTTLEQLGLSTQNTVTDIMNALPLHSVADIGVSASGEAPLNLSLPVIGPGRLIVSKQTTDARGTAKFYVYSAGDTYENKWYNSAFTGWYRHLTSVGDNTIADGILALLNGHLNITRETDPYVNLFNLAGGGDRVGIHWYGTATGQNTFGIYDAENGVHLLTISQSTRQAKFAGNIVDGAGNVLSGKLTASGIVNNATTTASGYVLDGRMGKTLNDKIVQLQNNTGNFKFRMGTVTVNCPPGEPGATYISYSGFTQPPKVFATVVSTWAEFLTPTVDPNNTTTQARVRVFNRNTASGGQWNGPVNWIAIGL